MHLKLLEPPGIEPVTLAVVKAHLRLDSADEDQYLESLIAMARTWVETYTGRALIRQKWHLHWRQSPWDVFGLGHYQPHSGSIILPKAPLLDIHRVTALMDEHKRVITNYKVIEDQARPRLEAPLTHNAYQIIFSAGYGDRPHDIPADLQYCLVRLVGLSFDQRRFLKPDEITDVRQILDSYRLLTMG